MASPLNALLCALIATGFWTLLGYAMARHLVPRVLAVAAAGIIGWAVHSAIMLPIHMWIGFSPAIVAGVGAACILAAGFSLSVEAANDGASASAMAIPPWAVGAAALLALIPAAAILPKFAGDAVQLSDPIFDHAKSAMIDAMARLGVPPVNAFFGEPGGLDRLAYYYLWHFSAAEVALVAGTTGWEADIGLTWFTAFTSLVLMMGLAVWLAKRSAAAIWTVALAAAGSLWVTLNWIFHAPNLSPYLWPPVGMAGWLFQATWVPQHLMAAACVVTAMVLLAHYARRQGPWLVLLLALVIVAGFESSTFVGGVTFALAGLAAAPILFVTTAPMRRGRFVAGLAVGALLVVCMIAPFLRDQFAAVEARGGGSPLAITPYAVFGAILPYALRRILDIPAYWLIILPIELPAAYIAGVAGLIVALRSKTSQPEKLVTVLLTCLAGAGLVASWLLVSTLGVNNDLGLRAFIPAAMILIVSAAALLSTARPVAIAVIALAGLALSLPDTAKMIRDNSVGVARAGGPVFARSPEMWVAVRRHTPPAARIANNPLYVNDMTPWPVNISWALLSDRSSCFAGLDLALAFAPLSPVRRELIGAQFQRVFAGTGSADDVHDLARKYDCEAAVIVPQDGAWSNDPFATSADFRLADASEGRWRIYVRAP